MGAKFEGGPKGGIIPGFGPPMPGGIPIGGGRIGKDWGFNCYMLFVVETIISGDRINGA